MDICVEDPHPMYKSNQWPREELLPGWKEETQRIQHKLVEIAMKLIEAFALAMGEEANCLQRWYQGDNSQCSLIRFLRYPPTPTDDRHTGCGAHSDYGLLTLLLQVNTQGNANRMRKRPKGARKELKFTSRMILADCKSFKRITG
eukprot:TRINITY_DN894_c0_g1_i3.p1 TRINITY_DN894_c0_g1~~TRINITY_DN894_c0_g1_i3.p1  ORF type:complete len:145 (+),score=17.42 TRINITY_DN894_c0_g1_i3:392-826(+)